ncbi:8-oxo-dGTP diphosphatase [Alkalibaculum bacchi]|uniref:8-oxo-dGTP diphosphatase n=1 Tax=Alkalibaculum bacchi TaxID=645887 RepID=A0A366I2P8_9FIRM|nr:(deoxy)nucleoside triphosphate pyrophosphohydrolase [Alkalibaculum bacchi]RBP61858.1 8-oxo-dGTP diphosphatase [Alkalibaculum bacchi]
MKHYYVTAAILINNGEILCMQRGPSKYEYVAYKYEFPGGKVEESESLEGCLQRELKEEMGIVVEIMPEQFFMTVEHSYPDFAITMHTYICPVNTREFIMHEHKDFKWLPKEKISVLDWADADKPIVESLLKSEVV